MVLSSLFVGIQTGSSDVVHDDKPFNYFCHGNGESMVTDRFVHRPGMNIAYEISRCRTVQAITVNTIGKTDVFGTSSLQEMFVVVVCSCWNEESKTDHHALCHLKCK